MTTTTEARAVFTGHQRGELLGLSISLAGSTVAGFVEPFGTSWVSVRDLAGLLGWRPSEVLAVHARLRPKLREAAILEPESDNPLITFGDACRCVNHRQRFGRGRAPVGTAQHFLTLIRLTIAADHALVHTSESSRHWQRRHLWDGLRGGVQ